mgnify:CR=1 FL=1
MDWCLSLSLLCYWVQWILLFTQIIIQHWHIPDINIVEKTNVPFVLDDDENQHPHEQLNWGKNRLALKSIDYDQKNVNACNSKYHENNAMENHQGPSQSRCINKRILRRVCVFCGSQSGNKDVYGLASIELGKALVCQSWSRYIPLLLEQK